MNEIVTTPTALDAAPERAEPAAAAPASSPAAAPPAAPAASPAAAPPAAPASSPAVALYEPSPAGPDGRSLPIDALRDVELSVEVILGRARMTLRELLSAQPHTTIELDRPIRSPVDVMVNGTLFARGEMVVVGDSEIGVQITEVIGSEPVAEGES